MPVVVDPGVRNPYEFIGAVINRRLPNPFMPDAPQRIAMDTSQKLPIRFGETLKKYIARGLDKSNLVLIPLTLAGYARYLKGIKDDGTSFDCSPDPMLEELQAIVAPLEIGKADQDWSPLKTLNTRKVMTKPSPSRTCRERRLMPTWACTSRTPISGRGFQ